MLNLVTYSCIMGVHNIGYYLRFEKWFRIVNSFRVVVVDLSTIQEIDTIQSRCNPSNFYFEFSCPCSIQELIGKLIETALNGKLKIASFYILIIIRDHKYLALRGSIEWLFEFFCKWSIQLFTSGSIGVTAWRITWKVFSGFVWMLTR